MLITLTIKLINNNYNIFDYLIFYIDLYFIELPSIIGQFTFSMIILKSILNLKQLNDNNLNDLTIKNIFDEYNKYYIKFEKEYNIWFIIMFIKILSIFGFYWLYFTNYGNYFHFDPIYGVLFCIFNGIILIEYIYISNYIYNEYNKLKDKLILMGQNKHIDNDNDNFKYLYLLKFISNKQIIVNFIKNNVTSIENAISYLVIGLLAAFIANQII